MASWATLATSTLYTTLLTQINDRDVDAAKAFDPANTTVTSPLTNHVRYNSANKRWELYNGTTWGELLVAATDAFAMTVTGVRGGNFYGTITNNGTISGGTGNFTTLQVASSAVWTVASLTNNNQLTNGASYTTAAAMAALYAPLASPTLTGVPVAPTAVAGTNTTQIATTAFVVGQGYATSASLAGTYAPIGGAGTSGTWGISISGNAATVTQRTFSRARTDGVTRGSYGSISLTGSDNSYAGIDFNDVAMTLMVNGTTQGFYRNNTTWDWFFQNGVLSAGTVPWASVTGSPSDLAYFSNSPGFVNAGGSVAFATSAGTATNVTGGGTVTATTGNFTGLLKGHSATSGGIGLGAITVSTSTGPRSGMVAGDLHGVY